MQRPQRRQPAACPASRSTQRAAHSNPAASIAGPAGGGRDKGQLLLDCRRAGGREETPGCRGKRHKAMRPGPHVFCRELRAVSQSRDSDRGVACARRMMEVYEKRRSVVSRTFVAKAAVLECRPCKLKRHIQWESSASTIVPIDRAVARRERRLSESPSFGTLRSKNIARRKIGNAGRFVVYRWLVTTREINRQLRTSLLGMTHKHLACASERADSESVSSATSLHECSSWD